jgi:hypothetical protein
VVADGDQPCEELVVLAVRGGGKSVGGKEGIGAHAEVRRVDVGVPIALGASSQQLGVLALAERAERAGVVEIGHSSDGVRSVIGVAEMIEYPGATHGGVGIGALRDPLVTAQPLAPNSRGARSTTARAVCSAEARTVATLRFIDHEPDGRATFN